MCVYNLVWCTAGELGLSNILTTASKTNEAQIPQRTPEIYEFPRNKGAMPTAHGDASEYYILYLCLCVRLEGPH